jgi:hypothetical protein
MARKRKRTPADTPAEAKTPNSLIATLSILSAAVYYFSNPKPGTFYDYTFRVAENLLRGGAGFSEKPPAWLNEFVPFDGFWYSVFPFGAVVTMIPFALLKTVGAVTDMPSAFVAALCAGISCLFMLLIARGYGLGRGRSILMTLAMLFGTWTWTNVTFGGAWQLALGFAMVGELGAIYFTLIDRRPLIAGAFFALAFGNRTEILLTAPILLIFLNRGDAETQNEEGSANQPTKLRSVNHAPQEKLTPHIRDSAVNIFRNWRTSVCFCAIPFVLGVATLVYNYVRFDSFADFGYARIPGVLNEPWYNHGIFSPYYIPRQMWEMLFKVWEFRPGFSLPMPNPFSSSVLISSPFLLFVFRFGARDRMVKYVCWAAVAVICLLLWMHGNSGGWQFGYRYAIAILPFLFVIMLENAPKKISILEWIVYAFSFIANAYATWLFHWTDRLKP